MTDRNPTQPLERDAKYIENEADYSAAKAGVIGLTRELAATLGPLGIYVNKCISLL